jgi:hypothetical protein
MDITSLTSMVLPDLMWVEDLAARLRRSPSAVRDMLRRGMLPGRKVGRRWLVERGALLRAVAPDNVPLRLVTPRHPRPRGSRRAGSGDEARS